MQGAIPLAQKQCCLWGHMVASAAGSQWAILAQMLKDKSSFKHASSFRLWHVNPRHITQCVAAREISCFLFHFDADLSHQERDLGRS